VAGRLLYSFEALNDFLSIRKYGIETWGRAQADRYEKLLETCCHAIHSGSITTQDSVVMDRPYAMARCRHHRIFFIREEANTIVLAVLHERMDLVRHMEDRL